MTHKNKIDEVFGSTGVARQGPWSVRAVASWIKPGQFIVRIEHDEPERGGWIRYLLGQPGTGPRYFASLDEAQAAGRAFLAAPRLDACWAL